MDQCMGYIYSNVYHLLNSLWDCKLGRGSNKSDMIIFTFFYEVSSTVLNEQRKQQTRIAVVKAWYNNWGDQIHCSHGGKVLLDRTDLTELVVVVTGLVKFSIGSALWGRCHSFWQSEQLKAVVRNEEQCFLLTVTVLALFCTYLCGSRTPRPVFVFCFFVLFLDILLQQHYGAINAVPNCYTVITMNKINSTLASLLPCVIVIVLILIIVLLLMMLS